VLDTIDLGALRIFIGHRPVAHLHRARNLAWLQVTQVDSSTPYGWCLRMPQLACAMSSVASSVSPSNLVVLRAPHLASIISPIKHSLAGAWTALRALDLTCCTVTALPESFGELAALQHLNLEGCRKLASLPESFGKLAALQHLNLAECRNVVPNITVHWERKGELSACSSNPY
jgi:hypothetical protein